MKNMHANKENKKQPLIDQEVQRQQGSSGEAETLRTGEQITSGGQAALVAAAQSMDWMQVVLHQGEPCFHLCEDGHFCGRANTWPGHDETHRFRSFGDLLDRMSREMAAMNDRWSKLHHMLATHPDADWDEAPFGAIKALQRLKATPRTQGLSSEETGDVQRCAEALVKKIDLIHKDERYKSIWFTAANHGVNYNGPKYDGELRALKDALIPVGESRTGVSVSKPKISGGESKD